MSKVTITKQECNCYIDLVGAIFNVALQDYYTGSQYTKVNFEKLTNDQKEMLRFHLDAKNFLDKKHGEPYTSLMDNFSVEGIKEKWERYNIRD